MDIAMAPTAAHKQLAVVFSVLAILLLMLLSPAGAAGIAVRSGQRIAFLGDSITAYGWQHTAGYVRLVVNGLADNGIAVTAIPAGVPGNTSKDMAARLNTDVLAAKPDWMTLSCGVNDVWRGTDGVPLEQYKANITSIIDRDQAAGIKVMVLTSTPITEDVSNAFNATLASYNAFLRDIAGRKSCLFADTNAGITEGLKAKTTRDFFLTIDGVHMNPRGDMIMASGILKAFGLSDAQVARARAVWMDMPGGWSLDTVYKDPDIPRGRRNDEIDGHIPLTIRQYEALNRATEAKFSENGINYTCALYAVDCHNTLIKPNGLNESINAIYDMNKQKDVTNRINAMIIKQLEDLIAASPGPK